MTRNDLERKLEDIPPGARDVEPPEDLLARLKADIPSELSVAERREESSASPAWTHRLKIAAAVVLVVGGGYLAARLLPEIEPPASQEAPAVVSQPSVQETDALRDKARDDGQAGESRDEALKKTPARQGTREAPEETAADALVPLGYVESGSSWNEERQRVKEPTPQPKSRSFEAEVKQIPRSVRGESAGVEALESEPPAPPAEPAPPAASATRLAPVPEEIVIAEPAPKPQAPALPESARAEPKRTFRNEIRVEGEMVRVISEAITGTVVQKEEGASELQGLSSLPNLTEGDFVDVRADPFSTFGLEVDTGSYTLARRHLMEGRPPPPESVRVEEWLNAFDYGDPAPTAGIFSMVAQGAPSPFGGLDAPARHVLRLGVKATETLPIQHGAASLTFVVDVSGSMEGPERLGLVKQSLGLLLSELRPEDSVALVTYGSEGRVILPHTRDKEAIRAVLNGLVSGGSTNAEEGLVLGYREAEKAFRPEGVNRVILCSDGVANVGATGPDAILKRIREQAERGIELTTLGFGMGTYNDHLMERLADLGDGRYAYVDDLQEAHRLLVEELAGTLMTVAEDARVQVEWNPAAVRGYGLVGYENRAIPDEEFRYDTTDAGEIGPGHTVTALYEIELAEPVVPGRPLGVWRIRYRDPATDRFVEESRYLTPADLAPSWEESPPALRFAALVASAARSVEAGEMARLERIAASLRRVVETAHPDDARKMELVEMLESVGPKR